MINPNCCFLHAGRCTVLTQTGCPGCKFCKTDLEYIADRERAQRILYDKGLEAYRDGDVITTKKRRQDV